MFMKQVKLFLVVLMVVVMGVSVTSCLKGDDNQNVTMTLPVKYDFSSFIAPDGTKLVPTTDVRVLTGTMYIITYQYDRSQVTDNKRLSVTLLGSPLCIDPKGNEGLTTQKTEATNPLYALNKEQFGLVYYDKNTIVVTMPYWVKVEGNTVEESEAKKHSFILSYDPETIKASDTKLTLNISHCIEEETESVTRSNWTYAYRAYSLYGALYQFKEKTGKMPQYLVLKAQTNSSEDKLKENGESTVEYEYSFKE